ncbi:MAG: DUF58 domain-containing protein [Acidobacteria bacterium]|jgi:uncharacterized protein (DUF58 family)|nr:DUF58 domain-containing protein [Acidobacteriota bacterium]|tara:strand:- start:4522 stop:5436 length:915 start_codon:yes stop_codon:yes gene_type:complete
MATQVTTAPGARFIDPNVLARLGSIELAARFVVEGFINGLHKAPYLGVSIDFAEHRGYMPGDDIRRIDWRLFARTDRFYVKQFEADTNTNFSVLFDVSKSMSFGSRGITKLDYGRYLAACLSYLSTKQRDRVGIVTFDDDIVERVPPSAKHFDVTLHTLDKIEAGRPGALGPPLYKATEFFKRRSILVVISDFYEEPEKIFDAVKPLRFAGNDVIMFHLLDPAEVDFPYDDSTSFQDLETGRKIPVVPDKLRDQYRELVREHIQAITQLASQNRIDYAFMNTKMPLDHALLRYLMMRHKLTKVR